MSLCSYDLIYLTASVLMFSCPLLHPDIVRNVPFTFSVPFLLPIAQTAMTGQFAVILSVFVELDRKHFGYLVHTLHILTDKIQTLNIRAFYTRCFYCNNGQWPSNIPHMRMKEKKMIWYEVTNEEIIMHRISSAKLYFLILQFFFSYINLFHNVVL